MAGPHFAPVYVGDRIFHWRLSLVGYGLFGLSGLIWALVLVPIQLRQRVLLKRFQAVTPEYLKLSRIWQISGAIATVVPLPIVYLMIVKGI